MKHWFSECPYLEPVIRPRGWKSNAQTAKKVEEALKDPVSKEKVEKSRERQKERKKRFQNAASSSSTTSNPPASEQPSTFATIWHRGTATDVTAPTPTSYSVDKAINYDILNCWILDSGSNIHVCNDPSRFQITYTTTHQDYLVSGSITYPIEAYGTVDVLFDTPSGQKISIKLRNVALIPGFLTNLVSFSKAVEAGIYWHTKKNTLYTETSEGKNHFCLLKPHKGHWIVEYNDPPNTAIAYASSIASTSPNTPNTTSPSTPIEIAEQASPPASSTAASTNKTLTITPTQLHQIMGHAGVEAITKLPSTIDGVRLSSPYAKDEFVSCEACRQSKAHRIIVRSSDSEVPTTHPLQRITYDLIQLSTAFNSDQYVSHFVCDFTGYH